MNSLRSIVAVAALATYLPAQAATTDPEVIIYRVSGVVDTGGGGGTGIATAFACSNFSGVPETVRFVVRGPTAALLANAPFTVAHLNTITVTTRAVAMYVEEILNTSLVNLGTAAIAATSVNVTCTAMQVNAEIVSPVGIALHMTRFNPVPGTQE